MRAAVPAGGTLIALLLAAVCFIPYLLASIGDPICFDDCLSYIVLMGQPLFSLSYWDTLYSMFRPLSVPVLYSMFGDFTAAHRLDIVFFQTLLAFGAWVTFAFALSAKARTAPLKMALCAAIMLMMFGRGYVYFNRFLLSDSLALSLILLWYAIILHMEWFAVWERTASPPARIIALLAFTGFTLLAVCTRDTNVFLALFAVFLLPAVIPARRLSAIIAAIIIVACVSQVTFNTRNTLNMRNIIAGIVLPDPEKRAFFEQRGMPVDPLLLRDKTVVKPWDFTTLEPGTFCFARIKVEKTLGDFPKKARGVWLEYLLSHPLYVAGNMVQDRQHILNQSFIDQHSKIAWNTLSITDDVPFDVLAMLFLLTAILHGLLPQDMRTQRQLVRYGIVLALAGFTNAAIAFHGDFWEYSEMQRHPFIGSIFFKIGCATTILGTLAELYAYCKNRRAALVT